MNYDNVIYGYSPLHSLIAKGIVEGRIGEKTLLVGTYKFIDNKLLNDIRDFGNVDLIIIPDTSTNQNLLKRLIARPLIFLKLRRVKCANFFTANELSQASQIIEKKGGAVSGIIIDEGFLRGALIKEGALKRYRFREHLRNVLNGSKKTRFDNPVFDTLITGDEEYFSQLKLTKKLNIVSFEKFWPVDKLSLSAASPKKPVAVLVTSPVTENNNAEYNWQEVEILEKLVKENTHVSFLLKPHYREDWSKKYFQLLEFSNVQLVQREFLDLPLQVFDLENYNVIGFHSSVLSDLAKAGHGSVYSLSGMIKSPHAKSFHNILSEKMSLVTSPIMREWTGLC